jgi:hypothetical protein
MYRPLPKAEGKVFILKRVILIDHKQHYRQKLLKKRSTEIIRHLQTAHGPPAIDVGGRARLELKQEAQAPQNSALVSEVAKNIRGRNLS